jgi:hypothetical protein
MTMHIDEAADDGRAFSLAEHELLAAWAGTMRPRGLRLRIGVDHEAAEEIAEVGFRWADEVRWMILNRPDGVVVDDLWQATPKEQLTTYATLEDALAAITATVDEEDAGDASP